jgi:hypothetical protein
MHGLQSFERQRPKDWFDVKAHMDLVTPIGPRAYRWFHNLDKPLIEVCAETKASRVREGASINGLKSSRHLSAHLFTGLPVEPFTPTRSDGHSGSP